VQRAYRSQRNVLRIAYVGAQLVSPKAAIFYMFFFTSITYLATLDVISSVLGLQSNSRPALQSAKRLILNAIFFDYYFSAPAAPWALSRGGSTWCLLV
jgi:hypothetical protein